MPKWHIDIHRFKEFNLYVFKIENLNNFPNKKITFEKYCSLRTVDEFEAYRRTEKQGPDLALAANVLKFFYVLFCFISSDMICIDFVLAFF